MKELKKIVTGQGDLYQTREPVLFPLLALVLLITIGLMTVFEVTSQWIFPELIAWQSHLLTIVFSGLISTALAFAVSRWGLKTTQHKQTMDASHESVAC